LSVTRELQITPISRLIAASGEAIRAGLSGVHGIPALPVMIDRGTSALR
jgi:hypothetical protein